jgi:hypothetical protein
MVDNLRKQIRHLEESIKNFTHFGGSDYDIRKMLELMGMFLGEQGKNISEDWKPIDGV